MPNDIVFLALDQVLLAALSGAAVGAAAGGLAGALIGMGIPEVEAKAYEGKIKDGSILVSVHTEDSKEGDPKARASAPGARASAPNPASTRDQQRDLVKGPAVGGHRVATQVGGSG